MTSDPQAHLHLPFEIAAQRPPANARVWYLAGMCPYFGAIGVQNVVFMWLMTQILHASPAQVGLSQMLTMLPMLTVILLGGVVADRRELRRHLILLQVIMALLPLSLVLCIGVGRLSYWGLVSVSVAIGVMGAFIVPARDAMLSRVEDGEMQRTVTAMTGLQFASQIAGLSLGGSAGWLAVRLGAGPGDPLGAAGLLGVQGALVLVSTWCDRKLSAASPHGSSGGGAFATIAAGFGEAMRDATIRPILLLMFFIGTMFAGVFLVQIPLLVRDLYQGGSAELALLNISFMGGTTLMVLALRRAPPIRLPGKVMLLSSCVSTIVIGLISLAPSFSLMCLRAAAWGGSGGLIMIMARTLVQAAAPAHNRGRILSIFQLAYVGGAPVGSFVMGLVIAGLGVVNAVLMPAAGMALVLLAAFSKSNIWRQRL